MHEIKELPAIGKGAISHVNDQHQAERNCQDKKPSAQPMPAAFASFEKSC